MRRLTALSACLLLGLAIIGCSQQVDDIEVDLVLVGGDIIDVESGEILTDHDVWISAGQIVALQPSGQSPFPRGTATVDVGGRFLVPGLVDAHVHLDHVDELDLYLSQGVTSVFNMRGLPRHLEWRGAIARGERSGPSIYTAGDYMDGYPPSMQPMMSFDSAQDAASGVAQQKAAGYDMIKVYTQLSLEQLQSINEAAREVGIPVVGHGSSHYTLQQLIDSGQANLAHSQDLLRWYLDPEDPEGLSEIVETLRGSGLTVTPNFAFTAGLIRQAEDLDGLLAEPIAQALPAAVLQPFRRANNRYIRRGIDWLPDIKERLMKQQTLARELHTAGVTLLAGSDASTSGVLPGSSLHLEIELLVEAGLSPLEALRIATLLPGRFISEHTRAEDPDRLFGQVAKGYRADLLVLEANPLEGVARLRNALGVVARGRYFSRQELDQRVEELAAESRALTPQVIELENAIYSGDLDRAREIFDTVRAESPGEVPFSQYVPFFVGFGFLYGEEGYSPDPQRLSAALELYRMYAEIYPEYHSAHYMLALALEANDQEAAAIDSLNRALEIHPFYPDARKKLAELRAP